MDEKVSLKEMVQLLRTQKHDILNHLQVIQGFLQLNKPELVRQYVTDTIEKIQDDGSVLRIQSPQLVGVLCIYRNKLEYRGAEVAIIIEDFSWEQSLWDDKLAHNISLLGDTLLEATELLGCKVELVFSIIEGEKKCLLNITNWPEDLLVPDQLVVEQQVNNNLVKYRFKTEE